MLSLSSTEKIDRGHEYLCYFRVCQTVKKQSALISRAVIGSKRVEERLSVPRCEITRFVGRVAIVGSKDREASETEHPMQRCYSHTRQDFNEGSKTCQSISLALPQSQRLPLLRNVLNSWTGGQSRTSENTPP